MARAVNWEMMFSNSPTTDAARNAVNKFMCSQGKRFFTAKIGDQNVIVTKTTDGDIRAWHNTCRHRGSVLCKESTGRFRNGRIICPYHTWTFSLEGELLATPGRIETEDFDASDYSLFGIHVDTWRGFVFVNLSDVPAVGLDEFLGSHFARAHSLGEFPKVGT